MSNILYPTSATKGMDFHLEGTLRVPTMDQFRAENQIEVCETGSHTAVLDRKEYYSKDYSISSKHSEVPKLIH